MYQAWGGTAWPQERTPKNPPLRLRLSPLREPYLLHPYDHPSPMTSPEMIADPLVGEGCEKRPLWPASGRGYAWGEEALHSQTQPSSLESKKCFQQNGCKHIHTRVHNQKRLPHKQRYECAKQTSAKKIHRRRQEYSEGQKLRTDTDRHIHTHTLTQKHRHRHRHRHRLRLRIRYRERDSDSSTDTESESELDTQRESV